MVFLIIVFLQGPIWPVLILKRLQTLFTIYLGCSSQSHAHRSLLIGLTELEAKGKGNALSTQIRARLPPDCSWLIQSLISGTTFRAAWTLMVSQGQQSSSPERGRQSRQRTHCRYSVDFQTLSSRPCSILHRIIFLPKLILFCYRLLCKNCLRRWSCSIRLSLTHSCHVHYFCCVSGLAGFWRIWIV